MSESTQTEAASAPGDELARAERTYTYDDRRYLFDVQITGVVGAVAAVAGVVMTISSTPAIFAGMQFMSTLLG